MSRSTAASQRRDDAPITSDAELPPQFSDDALALRFTEKHGENLRYTSAHGPWSRWTGNRWDVMKHWLSSILPAIPAARKAQPVQISASRPASHPLKL